MSEIPSFGAWLKRRRKALDLTQDALARRVGCSVVSIRKFEGDEQRPSRQLAELLAAQLQIAPEERATFIQFARLGLDAAPPELPLPAAARLPARTAPQPPSPVDRPPRAAPSGTVTFLFTDIEASTRLWEQHPQAMPSALARHDAILSEVLATHTGVVVKRTGDGLLAAFAQATAALGAARTAQQALQTEDWRAVGLPQEQPLRVRMVLHTGVVAEHAGDYVGPPLNRAARLLAVGHGGQIVLSRATWELVADQLPADVELRDLGVHRLKDLSRPEHIFQLVAPDLRADFPALRTLDARPTNLPAQPTALIGREREVATLLALLRRADVRLVTLIGPGGVGKTRVALQVAADALDAFMSGAYFVALAPLSDPDLVIATIAQTLEVREASGQPLIETLKAELREKQLLLVLDNFEQVVAAAPQIADLLAACPRLKVLVTSREVLRLSGEHGFPVPPLALPDLQRPPAEADLVSSVSQYAAVALFIERAQAARADFAVTNQSAPAVAEICVRLDGLPLAIELAAARIKLFAPEALLERLEGRLGILTGGPRDAPARQQTIRNTIDWSHQLLTPAEQTLFRRLAVFVGGWTLEAAAAVCDVDGDLGLDLLDGMQSLVDKSLVRQEAGLEGEPRFRRLETIREYALEQLGASDEVEHLRQRHAGFFLALAEAAESHLISTQRQAWLELLETEYDNLRAVLVWSQANPDGGPTGLRLAGALWWFWYFRGYAGEGRHWLEETVARTPSALTAPAYLWTLCGAGMLAFVQGDHAPARDRLSRSVAGWRAHGDARGLAYALTFLGLILQYQYDPDAACPLHEESIALFRTLDDRWGLALALNQLADLCYFVGDLRQARALCDESIAHACALDDIWTLAWALSCLGFVAYAEGDMVAAERLFMESVPMLRAGGDKLRLASSLNKWGNALRCRGDIERATALYEESVTLFRELNTRLVVAGPLHNLGFVALHVGNDVRAAALFAESIEIACQQHDHGEVATCLGGFAAVAGARGRLAQAARLFGAADALLVANNEDMDVANRMECSRSIATVRAQLGDAAFAAAWAEGQALPLEQAVAYALDPATLPEPAPDMPPTNTRAVQPPD